MLLWSDGSKGRQRLHIVRLSRLFVNTLELFHSSCSLLPTLHLWFLSRHDYVIPTRGPCAVCVAVFLLATMTVILFHATRSHLSDSQVITALG
jgi:hypothetical protein